MICKTFILYLLSFNGNYRKWSRTTFKQLLKFWKSPEGGELGISLVPCYFVSSNPNYEPPKWKDVVFGFRDMTAEEMRRINKPNAKYGAY